MGVDAKDLSTLSWCLGEIRESLERAGADLEQQLRAEDGALDRLRAARGWLHQAHGALALVDLEGVTVVTQEAEALLDRIERGERPLDVDTVRALGRAFAAVVEYLEGVAAGSGDSPVSLFPQYRDLLAARGAERIEPADLFSVDLGRRPPRGTAADALDAAGVARVRAGFEKGLLAFLRDPRDRDALALLYASVDRLDRAQRASPQRAFWWLASAFFDALRVQALPVDVYAKRLVGRINLQIRNTLQRDTPIADRMLRDILFMLARAGAGSSKVEEARRLYDLAGRVPADFEQPRYGVVDARAMRAAREATAQAKDAWERAARGSRDALPAFAAAAQQLDAALGRLPWSGLRRLGGVFAGLRRVLVAGGPELAELIALEVATALLFLEQALERGPRAMPLHDPRAAEMAERIERLTERRQGDHPAPPEWLGPLAQAAQERLTSAALVAELQTNLRASERTLDAFFRDPAQRTDLPAAEPLLRQVSGALRLLGHQDAAEGADAVLAQVRAFIADDRDPLTADCERVAASLGALGFYVDGLRDGARGTGAFRFAREEGRFIARLETTARSDRSVGADAAGDSGHDALEATRAGAVPSAPPQRGAADRSEGAIPEPMLPEGVLVEGVLTEGVLVAEVLVADVPGADASTDPAATDRASTDLEFTDLAFTDLAFTDPASTDRASTDRASTDFAIDGPQALEPEAGPSLESLLAERRAGLPSLLQALQREPAATVHRTRLGEALRSIRDEAMLLDDGELRVAAADALARLDAGVPSGDDALLDVLERVAGTGLRAAAEAVPVALPVGPALDQELLAVFLDEADEVLAAIADGCIASRRSPGDLDVLSTLRRSFHTLKGSSRMVGLTPFGEAAWALEQVLNGWLAEERRATPSLHALVDAAQSTMHEWVQAMRADPDVVLDPSALVALAGSLGRSDPVQDAAAGTGASDAHGLIDLSALAIGGDDGSDGPVSPIDALIELTEVLEPVEGEVPTLSPLDEVGRPDGGEGAIALPPGAQRPIADPRGAEDPSPQHGDADAVALNAIFLDEAAGLLDALDGAVGRWQADPSAPVPEAALRAAHTLTGGSRLVGLPDVQAAADALERFMLGAAASGRALQAIDIDDVGFVAGTLRAALARFAAGDPPADGAPMIARAEALARRWAAVFDVASDEGWGDGDPIGATSVETDRGPTDAPRIEGDGSATAVAPIDAGRRPDDVAPIGADRARSGTPPIGADPAAAYPEPVPEGLAALVDDIDPELAPTFVAEGDELLPRIGDALRAWALSPDDASLPESLMRLLHTVKGSARMAGAMRLGQLVHELETRIESAAALPRVPSALIEELVARHDQALALFEAIRDPDSTDARAAAQAVVDASAGSAGSSESVSGSRVDAEAAPPRDAAQPEPAATEPAARGGSGPAAPPLIRVRADLLDRLVNQAGEVSIARARLENELGGIRQSLGELTENVNRLRAQLREIELASDLQMQAREAREAERDAQFDPLEFDRYTRFQELTRLLAESVSDVATVQQNALRSLDEAGRDLARQNQVTRDLQQDLMRIRMVQFGSIADRLYRVVRQAAKELGKRVHLDLKGASAELDRGVLERMGGPIEHLLRNAVAHGIESRDERAAAGKPDAGEIVLEVRQDANEVVLTISDDGAGLNLERIHARAIERGLVAPGAAPGARELGELIFMPGFTTAAEVTAIAGRGIGMDVVRAEVAAMGGRIDLDSTPGRGTRFVVHLPVSLAVAQVVLLTVGPVRVAVPSALIEQVLQLKPEALAAAYARHSVDWQGQAVPLYFFGSLLELPACTPLAQRYSPVVVLRSGTRRIALHVDHVAPSQEVVVKHVGPQLARLTGMAGATVLGNGDIVLILNPVQIAATGRGAQAGQGDTASFAPTRIEIAPTVMVVDDSVTVRKVTQRLLQREGYQVMLAKDGLDALRQLQDVTPDVLLLDIEMPRMDGFDLTRNLRADERWREMPIVMITSRTADKHRNHAIGLGVDVFLGKPYDEAELLGHVAALAARRRAPA
jgi:chemosensory pili system protein ChpA (sensor histidine kinase/response regulator)